MQHVIGVADMKISVERDDVLITYALGSCLGITIYDPVACVGGMLHVMLPLSTIAPLKAKANPYMFIDTGVPRLFIKCYKAGAKKERLVVKVAGGACLQKEDRFQIGKRNFLMLKKLLWKNNVLLRAHDIGGTYARTMTLDISTGEVTIKRNGIVKVL